jgi:Tfp pilus assembly protein PilV
MRIRQKSESGASLVELMVAAFLIVAFFASIFELNAVCLRYVSAGKESLAALADVNDRAETLRNLSFTDLINPTVVSGILSAPANGSDFSARAAEVVKISGYPTPNGTTQFTRSPNGQVTVNSVATSLGASLVQIEVSCSWQAVFGQRQRSEKVTTIISNGTKK